MRKLSAIVIVSFLGLAVLLAADGCGGSSTVDSGTVNTRPGPPASAGDSLDQRIEAMKQMEMTVEIIEEGQAISGRWSQKGGSWRWESSKESNYYTIHNKALHKTWKVAVNPGSTALDYKIYLGSEVLQTGTLQPGEAVALKISGASESSVKAFDPAAMIGAFVMIPKTGGADDVWEIDVPEVGKISIEMKGPNGLPTKITNEDSRTGVTTTTQFVYSNIGNVPDSLFELPQNAKETTL